MMRVYMDDRDCPFNYLNPPQNPRFPAFFLRARYALTFWIHLISRVTNLYPLHLSQASQYATPGRSTDH
jgi:hypothetical protein